MHAAYSYPLLPFFAPQYTLALTLPSSFLRSRVISNPASHALTACRTGHPMPHPNHKLQVTEALTLAWLPGLTLAILYTPPHVYPNPSLAAGPDPRLHIGEALILEASKPCRSWRGLDTSSWELVARLRLRPIRRVRAGTGLQWSPQMRARCLQGACHIGSMSVPRGDPNPRGQLRDREPGALRTTKLGRTLPLLPLPFPLLAACATLSP